MPLPRSDLLRLGIIFTLWGVTLLGGPIDLTPRHLGLDVLAWICFFIAGLLGFSRLRDQTALQILYREQIRPRVVHDDLWDHPPPCEQNGRSSDQTAHKKLRQAYHKRRMTLARKLQRAGTTLRHKRLVQDGATLVAVALLIAGRVF